MAMQYYYDHYMCISTHILTKRMTIGRELQRMHLMNFNSHPHEEDDNMVCKSIEDRDISTHILTKRMTVPFLIFVRYIIFQLTSSRRG